MTDTNKSPMTIDLPEDHPRLTKREILKRRRELQKTLVFNESTEILDEENKTYYALGGKDALDQNKLADIRKLKPSKIFGHVDGTEFKQIKRTKKWYNDYIKDAQGLKAAYDLLDDTSRAWYDFLNRDGLLDEFADMGTFHWRKWHKIKKKHNKDSIYAMDGMFNFLLAWHRATDVHIDLKKASNDGFDVKSLGLNEKCISLRMSAKKHSEENRYAGKIVDKRGTLAVTTAAAVVVPVKPKAPAVQLGVPSGTGTPKAGAIASGKPGPGGTGPGVGPGPAPAKKPAPPAAAGTGTGPGPAPAKKPAPPAAAGTGTGPGGTPTPPKKKPAPSSGTGAGAGTVPSAQPSGVPIVRRGADSAPSPRRERSKPTPTHQPYASPRSADDDPSPRRERSKPTPTHQPYASPRSADDDPSPRRERSKPTDTFVPPPTTRRTDTSDSPSRRDRNHPATAARRLDPDDNIIPTRRERTKPATAARRLDPNNNTDPKRRVRWSPQVTQQLPEQTIVPNLGPIKPPNTEMSPTPFEQNDFLRRMDVANELATQFMWQTANLLLEAQTGDRRTEEEVALQRKLEYLKSQLSSNRETFEMIESEAVSKHGTDNLFMATLDEKSKALVASLQQAEQHISQAENIINNYRSTEKLNPKDAEPVGLPPSLGPDKPKPKTIRIVPPQGEALKFNTSNLFPNKIPISESDKAKYPYKEWDEAKPGYFYPVIKLPGIGKVRLTKGFMDPSGSNNGDLETYRSIFFDKKLSVVGKGVDGEKFGVGIDYIPSKSIAQCWHGGEIMEAKEIIANNNRVIIKTNVTYEFKGKKYPVYQSYTGLHNLNHGVAKGKTLRQGGYLGYPPQGADKSINLRTFIITNGDDLRYHGPSWIELHPNLVW